MARSRLPNRAANIAVIGLLCIAGTWCERESSISIPPAPSAGVYATSSTSSAPTALITGSGFTEITEQPSAESSPSDNDSEWTTNDNMVATTWSNLIAALAFDVRVGDAGLPPSPPPPPPPETRGWPSHGGSL